MADSHLEPPSSGCVSSLFVDVHDPLHQNPVEEHVAAGDIVMQVSCSILKSKLLSFSTR